MGEYGKYNVNELLEITATDNEESMRSIATGWVNTGSVLNTAKEALKERLEQMRGVWTAPSFGAFEEFINTTIAQVDAAQTQADNRGDAAGAVASTAGWARERVGEQYQEYLKATLTEATDDETAEVNPGSDEFRAPYDEQARRIMTVALEEYEQNKPAMTQDVVQFKPIPAPPDSGDDEWVMPGDDGWGPGGTGGSNGTDTAALSAASYGGNAAGPTLQSTGPTAPVSPTPGGSLPATPPASGPVFSGPPVAGLPPGTINKTSIAPPKLPSPGTSVARNYLAPRTNGLAPRTPGLPTSRNGAPRVGPNQAGRSAANSGGAPKSRSGKGLQKSQMAPKDLTKQVRSSGEVIGRRTAKAKAASASAKSNAVPRKVQASIVRDAKKNTGKNRADNTKRGYTSRVINPRNRISEASGHSRTPFVGDKMKHASKPEPIGKRQDPETPRTRARREIDAIRAKRREKLANSDGLSRPVIDNGLTNTLNVHNVAPTPRDAVKSKESFWQPQAGIVDAVIGKRRWNPDAIEHDPGPILNPRQARHDALDARVSKSHDPGPTAFVSKRSATDVWPNL